MKLSRPFATRAGGRMTSAALLFIAATALMPGRADAQCLTCFEASCSDYLAGAHFCTEGSYFSHGEWWDWCFTFGGMCEWIMQLDFAEDGTAYAARDPVSPTDEQTMLTPEGAETSRQTCDGVLLVRRRDADENALPEAPIILEL